MPCLVYIAMVNRIAKNREAQTRSTSGKVFEGAVGDVVEIMVKPKELNKRVTRVTAKVQASNLPHEISVTIFKAEKIIHRQNPKI